VNEPAGLPTDPVVRSRRGRGVAALLLVALLVVAACGQGDATSPPPTPPPLPGEPEATPSPQPEGTPTAPGPSPDDPDAPGPPATGAWPTAEPGTIAEDPGAFATDVEIGGRTLRLECTATVEDAPVVMFESGLGSGIRAWSPVVDDVGEIARACRYDRAGIGASDPADRPRTSEDIAEDLRALIDAAGLPTPLVLVGHSIAGLHLRVFADRYPELVAGMVLVDPSVPEMLSALGAALPPPRADEDPSITRIREQLADPPDPDTFPEGLDVGLSMAQVAETVATDPRPLGERPLVVLTAGRQHFEGPSELQPLFRQLWQRWHANLASISGAGRHEIVEDAGHSIQADRPEVVINAVREVVEAARPG
jgi:pimeloyl-ACP methyl ester carboxylesterase